jgi:hypothetical protein
LIRHQANEKGEVMPNTQYGFQYGPAEVSRIHSDPKRGVWIEIRGKRGVAVVRVTPSGIVKLEQQPE